MPLGPSGPTAAECPDLGHIENDTRAKTRIFMVGVHVRAFAQRINPSSRWKDRFKTEVKISQIQNSPRFSAAGFLSIGIKQIFGIETVRLGMIPLRWVFWYQACNPISRRSPFEWRKP
jgi:hypothetical protein